MTFVTFVQTATAQFYITDYESNPKSLARWWYKVLGSDFQSIKNMVDETGIIPDSWINKFPLRQLVDNAESYLCTRGVKDADEKKKDDKNKTEENLSILRKIRIRIYKAMAERNAP